MKLRNVLISTAALVAVAAPALADAKTESFVKQNANEVLNSLNNPNLSQRERTELFSGYMEQFADFDAVSKFVIGKYARRFTPEELQAYQQAFRTYALAVYENELDAYRGNEVVIEGSTDRTANDSIVDVGHAGNLVDQRICRPVRAVQQSQELRLLFDGQPDQVAIYIQRDIDHLVLATTVQHTPANIHRLAVSAGNARIDDRVLQYRYRDPHQAHSRYRRDRLTSRLRRPAHT